MLKKCIYAVRKQSLCSNPCLQQKKLLHNHRLIGDSRFWFLLSASRFGTILQNWRLSIHAIRDSTNYVYIICYKPSYILFSCGLLYRRWQGAGTASAFPRALAARAGASLVPRRAIGRALRTGQDGISDASPRLLDGPRRRRRTCARVRRAGAPRRSTAVRVGRRVRHDPEPLRPAVGQGACHSQQLDCNGDGRGGDHPHIWSGAWFPEMLVVDHDAMFTSDVFLAFVRSMGSR